MIIVTLGEVVKAFFKIINKNGPKRAVFICVRIFLFPSGQLRIIRFGAVVHKIIILDT